MSEWIRVKDRLPEPQAKVIAFSPKFKEYAIGQVCHFCLDVVCEYEDCVLCGVTHWMPLPEPPKEEN